MHISGDHEEALKVLEPLGSSPGGGTLEMLNYFTARAWLSENECFKAADAMRRHVGHLRTAEVPVD
jgi:hypothetical protein